jgi:hypothetical protein
MKKTGDLVSRFVVVLVFGNAAGRGGPKSS